MLTLDHMLKISGDDTPTETVLSNVRSIMAGLAVRGDAARLNAWHRLAHYLAQLAHESGRFKWDRELWGPTAAQRGYEGRKDLGNVKPGDGARFKGRTGGQITGRANYRGFTLWARSFDPAAPDFEADPEALNSDPWEGLGPLWFWETNGLVVYADSNNIEGLTKRWNGGLNGYPDRLELYGVCALTFLDYGTTDAEVRRFQRDAGLVPDGDVGPLTRAVMHKALAAKNFGPIERPPVIVSDVNERLARIATLASTISAATSEIAALSRVA